MKTRIIIISVLLAILCGCSGTSVASRSAIYFDTIVSIDIYGVPQNDREHILDECMNMCSHYEDLFDKNKDTSDIAKINKSAEKPVSVDTDTISLISEAIKYSKMSDGRFDITINPVTALWDFHEENGHIPSDEKLKEAVSKVDYHNISVDQNNMTVSVKAGTTIDAGAVAKGFIADRIAEYLSGCNVSGAIINMGGDIRLVGSKPDKTPFNIGINDPFDKGTVATSLVLSDTAVATSGTYERCFTINGKKYHHILDTDTGYPVKTDIESVTIITESAADADCLCTICIIEGSDEAIKLIENTEGVEAVFILTDGSMKVTSGAEHLIRN